jgi:hypothetical protein
METQPQTVLNLDLDQITNFIYHLDGTLVMVTYCDLTKSVFRVDTVKSSSCVCVILHFLGKSRLIANNHIICV